MPRFHPTYANVVSTLALFVALGGVGYAAVVLPANSVGTKQLKRGAVRNADVAGRAVTGAKVRNGSLRKADFKSGELPAGPKGAKGDRGAPGAAGQPPPVQAWRVIGAPGQPTFLNDWTNGDTTTYNAAAFFLDLSGVVHLRGVIAAGTDGPIFQLPPGYFPPRSHTYVASTVGGAPGEVQVSAGGQVSRVSFVAPSGALSLEGISFRVTG